MANIEIGGRLHSTATGNVVAGANEIYDDAKGKKQSVVNQETDAALDDRYTKSQTYNKEELNNMITTPNQKYETVTATEQTTAATDVLPATGAADTTYRVGNWDGTQYNDSVFSEYAWNGSAYIKLSTKSQIGEVYDISANHADTKYADLSAALGTNGANIPQSLRKGGMSVKYVQTSDNKYVQYRLTANAFSTNVSDWQGVDVEPIENSHNLIESGSVYNLQKTILGEDAQVIDLSQIATYNGIISNGKFILVTNSNYQYVVLNVSPNQKFKVVKGDIYRFTYALLKSYTVPAENDNADFCSGTSLIESGDSIIDITIPNDGNYLYVQVLASGVSKIPSSFTRLSSDGGAYVKSKDGFLEKYGLTVWQSNPDGDYSGLSQKFDGISRKIYYSAIRSAKFFGFDASVPRSILYMWKGYGDIFRLIIGKKSGSSWVNELDINVTLSSLTTVHTFIFQYQNTRAEFVVDTSLIPLDSNSAKFNTGEPELIFSDYCYDKSYDTLYGTSLESVDLQNLTQYGGLINNGKWALIGHGLYKYVIIPVRPNYTVRIIKNTANITYSVLSSYGTPQDDETPNFASGFSSEVVSAISTDVKIPSNGNFLYLYAVGGGNNVLPTSVTIERAKGILERISINENIQNVIKLYPKAQMAAVSFNFDDIVVEDSQIVELFDEYNAKCNFAFIADDAKIANYIDKYKALQKRGYGICSHSINANAFNLTNYPTVADARNAVFTAVNKLTDAGLVINGFVAPSSQWYDGQSDETRLEYLEGSIEKAHAYAFTYGDSYNLGRQSNPCRLTRYSIETASISDIKDWLDSYIAAGKIITLYAHLYNLGTGNFTIEKVKEILEYVIAKRDAGECYFGNTDDCVKYFFGL